MECGVRLGGMVQCLPLRMCVYVFAHVKQYSSGAVSSNARELDSVHVLRLVRRQRMMWLESRFRLGGTVRCTSFRSRPGDDKNFEQWES